MDLIYIIIGIVGALIIIFSLVFIMKRMKGSMEILPERYSYSSGETINGKLTLKLKKPVQSTGLIIGLRCERVDNNYSPTKRSINSQSQVVFDFNQPINREKDYAPSEYDYNFSIKVPSNVSAKLEGIAGNLIKSAQILIGNNYSFKWYLYSELKCSGINLTKKIQINVA